MGDLNAKRLLEENTRLKHERSEMSSVLGEEKEMVKYLHGVIKNYEHLLRSNSKRHTNRHRPLVHQKMTETEIDPDLISSEIQEKSSRVQKSNKELLSLDSEEKEKDMASLRCSLDRRHDMHGLQTVKKEVKQQYIQHKDSSVEDDVCLEDLEILSNSSTEESTDDSQVSPEMERKWFSENAQSGKHSKTSRTFDGTSRDRHEKRSDKYHRLNDHLATNTTNKLTVKESGGINAISKVHDRESGVTNATSKGNDRESIGINASSKGTHYKHYSIDSSLRHLETSTSFDTELDELNKELDRIASKLNRHEKSLNRSEKHLSKIEHRMEYLESFALGEESEYL